MRISKLAHNYDLTILELTDFLKTLNIPNQSLHPNARLSEDIIEKVRENFDFTLQEEPIEQAQAKEPIENNTPGEDTTHTIEETKNIKEATLDTTSDVSPDQNEWEATEKTAGITELLPEGKTKLKSHSEGEIIPSDQLLKMIESEGFSDQLDKIKLIKAPKKELSGLKILGKIEVSDTTKKRPKEQRETKDKATTLKGPLLSNEEKEKRRLRAKKRKEEYENRKERKRKEQEEKREKIRKAEHYKKTIALNKATTPKPKPKKQSPPPKLIDKRTEEQPKPQSKTILGKLWRWLNSSGYE